MTQDVDKGRIANATTKPDEHGEIEITPEMIEAGCMELSLWNQREDSYGDIVASKFEVMSLAKAKREPDLNPTLPQRRSPLSLSRSYNNYRHIFSLRW